MGTNGTPTDRGDDFLLIDGLESLLGVLQPENEADFCLEFRSWCGKPSVGRRFGLYHVQQKEERPKKTSKHTKRKRKMRRFL